MIIHVHIVRAFCRDKHGGNWAGVVILEHSLSSREMQSLATALNFSETIFLSKKEKNTYKALFYTPNSPIEFCGHATLAAFEVLKQQGQVKKGHYKIEMPIGIVDIAIEDFANFLSQPLPIFDKIVSEQEIESSLGVLVNDIGDRHLKPQIVSTGLRDIIIPMASQQCLFNIKPNYSLMTKLSEKYNVVGLHAFSLDPPDSIISAHCRNFAPRYGIPEESATGSSNGALACYLWQQNAVSTKENPIFLFKQGDVLEAPSDIYVRLTTSGKKIEKVECGGEVIIDEVRKFELVNRDKNVLVRFIPD